MAKKFYVLDEKGTIKSADGTKSYTLLQGRALYQFLKSPQGKKRKFTVETDDNGDEVGVEIPSHLIAKYKREQNYQEYIKRTEDESGFTFVSYDAVDVNGEVVSGDELVADDSLETAEEVLTDKEEIMSLKDALRSLTEEELYIIKSLYLDKPRRTEASLAVEFNVVQSTIHRQKLAILKKLKKILR